MPRSAIPSPGSVGLPATAVAAGTLALALVCSSGCSRPAAMAPGNVARAVTSDPITLVDPSLLLAARAAALESAEGPRERPCDFAAAGTGRWTVRCPAPTQVAAWRLVAELEGLLQAAVRLTLADPECRLDEGNRARRAARRGAVDRYELPLPRRAPACDAADFDLELRGAGPPGDEVVLHDVRLRRVDPAELLPDPKQPVRIRLGKDWRVGFVDAASFALSADAAASPPSSLRTSVAVVGTSACRIRVATSSDDGEVELKRLRIEPAGDGQETGWIELSTPLEPPSHGTINVHLSAECERGPADGLVIWGMPRVVARRPRPDQPNVLLISIDTLRADHLGLYGYPRSTSPRLDAWLSRNGVVFDEATAAAPWTYPSHVSMLTGIDAVRHGAYFGDQPIDLRPWSPLAARLRERGYSTMAVTGGGFVDAQLGFAAGFDLYRSWPDPATRDRELEGNLEFLRSLLASGLSEPFFLFFHTYEVHAPNRARQPYFGRFSKHPSQLEVVGDPAFGPNPANGFVAGSGALLRGSDGGLAALPADLASLPADLYDSAIAYTDERVGALLEQIDALGLARNTVVVFTSDHGESLGEHGRYWHGNIDEPNLRVPLVISLPERRRAGLRIAAPVRLIDIAPTLLDLVGESATGLDGVSLRMLLEGGSSTAPGPAWAYAASNNHGLALRRARESRFVLSDSGWPPAAGRVEAFDLAAGDAPIESPDPASISAFRRLALGKLARELVGVRIDLQNASDASVGVELSQGYIGPSTLKRLDEGVRLEWRAPGHVGLLLEPRASTTLVLLRADPLDFDARLRFEDSRCADTAPIRIRGARLSNEAPLETRLVCRSSGVEATIRLAVQPAGSAAFPSDISTDPLARELRALGYLQ